MALASVLKAPCDPENCSEGSQLVVYLGYIPVFRIRIHMFFDLPDPEPLVRGYGSGSGSGSSRYFYDTFAYGTYVYQKYFNALLIYEIYIYALNFYKTLLKN